MSTLDNVTSNATWLLRYIVTAETAALVMMLVFFATGWRDMVTHEELQKLPYPYLAEKQIISKHIRQSERAMSKIIENSTKLNERITRENHAVNLRITILEQRSFREKKRAGT